MTASSSSGLSAIFAAVLGGGGATTAVCDTGAAGGCSSLAPVAFSWRSEIGEQWHCTRRARQKRQSGVKNASCAHVQQPRAAPCARAFSPRQRDRWCRTIARARRRRTPAVQGTANATAAHGAARCACASAPVGSRRAVSADGQQGKLRSTQFVGVSNRDTARHGCARERRRAIQATHRHGRHAAVRRGARSRTRSPAQPAQPPSRPASAAGAAPAWAKK